MRVLLRLGDAQLRLARAAHNLAQNLPQLFRSENERGRVSHIVLRERYVGDLRPDFAVETVEIF